MRKLEMSNEVVAAAPMFRDCVCLHGFVDAICTASMGDIWAHERGDAAVAWLDFTFLGGDAGSPGATDAIAFLEDLAETPLVKSHGGVRVVCPTEEWEQLLLSHYGDRVVTREREAFSFGNGKQHEAYLRDVPEDFELVQVPPEDVEAMAENLDHALTWNFSVEDFKARGVAFGLRHQGQYVAAASSASISPNKLEFEVQTSPNFEGRGFATIVSAKLIQHCVQAGLEPCWDAANPASGAVAKKLGFASLGKYQCYKLLS